MAIAAGAVWEVRTTGNDNNGGGFVAGGGGTDLSLQDTAAYGGSNLTVDGTTNTKVTSAGHSFVGADVGNIMQITAGAGFTVGFYQILSVAAGAATLDRSPAAVSTAGGTYAVGGALASPGKAGGPFVSGNSIWIKTGTYLITNATANVSGGCLTPQASIALTSIGRIAGYGTTRGDSGKATLQASGISTFVMITTQVGNTVWNLILDGALRGSSRGMNATNGRAINCLALNCTNYGITGGSQFFCEATGCSGSNTYGLLPQFAYCCWSHDNVSGCNGMGPASQHGTLINCVASNNSGIGFGDAATASARFANCTAYSNDSHGFSLTASGGTGPADLINCLSYGNTGWGLSSGTNPALFCLSIFVGSNTAGAVTGGITVFNQTNLTADPFTNAGANDFSLNNAAGGGALVRAASSPGSFPGATMTSYLDAGALQHQDAGGAAGIITRWLVERGL